MRGENMKLHEFYKEYAKIPLDKRDIQLFNNGEYISMNRVYFQLKDIVKELKVLEDRKNRLLEFAENNLLFPTQSNKKSYKQIVLKS